MARRLPASPLFVFLLSALLISDATADPKPVPLKPLTLTGKLVRPQLTGRLPRTNFDLLKSVSLTYLYKPIKSRVAERKQIKDRYQLLVEAERFMVGSLKRMFNLQTRGLRYDLFEKKQLAFNKKMTIRRLALKKQLQGLSRRESTLNRELTKLVEIQLKQMKVNPYRPDFQLFLAQLYTEQQLERYITRVESWKQRVTVWLKQRKGAPPPAPRLEFPRAIPLLRSVLSQNPGYKRSGQAYYLLAFCYENSRRRPQAIQAYRQILKLTPRSPLSDEVQLRLAMRAFHQGYLQKAGRQLLKLSGQKSSRVVALARYFLIWTNYKLGRTRQAKQLLQALLRAVPRSLTAVTGELRGLQRHLQHDEKQISALNHVLWGRTKLASSGSGPLDASRVNATLQKHRRWLELCYTAQLKLHTNLLGQQQIRFRIRDDGRVDKLEFGAGKGSFSGLRSCLRKLFTQMHFSRPTSGALWFSVATELVVERKTLFQKAPELRKFPIK